MATPPTTMEYFYPSSTSTTNPNPFASPPLNKNIQNNVSASNQNGPGFCTVPEQVQQNFQQHPQFQQQQGSSSSSSSSSLQPGPMLSSIKLPSQGLMSPSRSGASENDHHHLIGGALNSINRLTRVKSLDNCRVCGDGPARMHYGVPTCFGCKGFFRRTLKRTKEYTCRYNGNCVVDRYERNSCRYCRFKRCLEVGMDPKAVRPDRDAAGRSHPIRHRRLRKNSHGELAVLDEEEAEAGGGIITDDWIRKMPVEMRTLLMQLMNIDLLVANGDTSENAKNLYPLPFQSLHQILEDPTCLDGKRTEIRYEAYRQLDASELMAVAHRRLIATIDTVDHLCTLMDLHNLEDKVSLIKFAYAPLTIFCAIAATAKITKNRDVLCLCNSGFVPRGAHDIYDEPYHFANHLVDRCLDELVEPFRVFNFKDQEVALMKYIVILNPHLRSLTTEAAEQIADFRDRIQETLYNVVRESHPKEVPSSRFGNLLLFLPNILILGNLMYENLQFIQTFRKQSIGPLLNELLDDNIEPVDLKNAHFDDITSTSSDDYKIHQSQSTSSISSMGSFDWQNQQHFLDYYATDRRASVSYHDLSSNGSNGICHQQQFGGYSDTGIDSAPPDSDPDYNITLTADTFRSSSNAHSMEIDGGDSSTEYKPGELQQQQCRPQFFIEPTSTLPCQQQQQQFGGGLQQRPTTVMGHGLHVFTVSNVQPLQKQQLLTNGVASLQHQHPSEQQTIMQKSQSYPYTSGEQQQNNGGSTTVTTMMASSTSADHFR